MNELALFAGSGLGLLGGKLLGWNPVCAVEIDKYRRDCLMQRQRDSVFPRFPIWDDICTFDGKPWAGLVDVVSAGVPCPKWSTARRGAGSPPDLLGEALRVIQEVRPRFALLECVPAFAGEAARIARFLKYAYRLIGPEIIDAAELGSPSPRKRCWFLAYADRDGESFGPIDVEVAGVPEAARASAPDWWERDPAGLVRVPDGRANRVDRLSAAGDGQVPSMVVAAWRRLLTPAWSRK